MYVDGKDRDFVTIKGKKAKVLYGNSHFNKEDMVIILEDDLSPYCVLEEDFNGNYDLYNDFIDFDCLEVIEEMLLKDATIEQLQARIKELEDIRTQRTVEKIKEINDLLDEFYSGDYEHSIVIYNASTGRYKIV